MMDRARLIAVATTMLFIVVAGCAPTSPRTESAPSRAVEPADTILVNGKVVTVDDRFTIAQALAIKNRRIVAVGSSADIRGRAGGNTRVIDLQGRTVIPGPCGEAR
jgi:adenine deaminase